LPLTVSLPQNLAKKFSVTGKTPQDPYAALPNFVSVEGTLGKVDTKVDKLVIAGLTLKAAGGLPVNLGGRTGDTIKGLGNFLTGEKPSTNNTTIATNKPSNTQTNKAPGASDLLNLFKK
ncbi:MAG TPA: hypothetical protein VK968_13105, partial [Roseimicrobium sp.]|nr:hypothetical protein [Roseimicrobium sp.]